jgi:hypothetical protein
MEKENLNFKIGLSRSTAKKAPEFSICLNGVEFVRSFIEAEPNEPVYFKFNADIQDGDQRLEVKLLNKSEQDTVVDSDGVIVDDLLLNIASVEIDEIDLGSLLWTASEYIPDYPASYVLNSEKQEQALPSTVKNCVNMGWNGTWTLPFSSPFYIWLIESL